MASSVVGSTKQSNRAMTGDNGTMPTLKPIVHSGDSMPSLRYCYLRKSCMNRETDGWEWHAVLTYVMCKMQKDLRFFRTRTTESRGYWWGRSHEPPEGSHWTDGVHQKKKQWKV